MPIMGTSQQATAIAAGYFHTCVLTQDGQVKCQGGYGSVYMDSLSDNDIAVVAGKGFTCVLTVQKTVDPEEESIRLVNLAMGQLSIVRHL